MLNVSAYLGPGVNEGGAELISFCAGYKNRRRDENPPHVFAVAEQAWQSMLENMDQSQSILVTSVALSRGFRVS